MFAGIDIASERHVLARLDETGPPRGRAALVGRAFSGRRPAGQGLGFDEELSAEAGHLPA